jgi:two-component system phosphate regulon sensor histidine kinase PhoR
MALYPIFDAMSTFRIRLLLILMLATISTLFVTQAYWFKKSFDVEARQFDEKINIALRNVAHRLKLNEGDYVTRIAPIEKLASNEYYVETKSHYSLLTLDSLLRAEFSNRNISVKYDYGIVEPESHKVLLGNTVFNQTIDKLGTDSILSCTSRTSDQNAVFDFKLRINNQTTYLMGSMGIWMYSSISLLIVLLVFTIIVAFILKGKKLNALKKDFINNMTHELKTPIANIAVASDAIRNRTMSEQKMAQYAQIIHKENDRLHSLVDRVLQISTIEKGTDTFAMELVDVNEVIQTVVATFEPLLQEKNGRISAHLSEQKMKILADKVHLANVVYNLIENAVKYSENAPEINIKTVSEKNALRLIISDKGIGMTKESQERIFEKFYRAETGNLHNTKGYGLGLSYVKMVVEQHKGLINFTSVLGKGSTFNILFPTH